MKKRRPSKVKALITSLVNDGITVVSDVPTESYARMSPAGCWSLTLIDPVHNHHLIQEIYTRYVERAHLRLVTITSRPGYEHGAPVGLIVCPRRKR